LLLSQDSATASKSGLVIFITFVKSAIRVCVQNIQRRLIRPRRRRDLSNAWQARHTWNPSSAAEPNARPAAQR